MTIYGYNYFHRRWLDRKRGFGPFFHIEQYGRNLYNAVGDLLSKICMVIFVAVLVFAFVGMVYYSGQAIWNWANTHTESQQKEQIEENTNQDTYLYDPCGLQDVYCPGEPTPSSGKASWLSYSRQDSCASRDWPKGTHLKVQSDNGYVVCVVRDFGPSKAVYPDRIVDLDVRQFSFLADPDRGVIDVTVTPL